MYNNITITGFSDEISSNVTKQFEHLNSLGKKFQEVIEVSYDTTLKLIDSTMQLLTSFRSDYITHYKNKLEKGVFTLKILKLMKKNKIRILQQHQIIHYLKLEFQIL